MDFLLFAANSGSGWSLNTFLKKLQESIASWGSLLVMIIGTVMVIGAAYHIAKGLMSQGKGQTNWAMTFLLLLVGGAFMASGGWTLLNTMSGGFQETINTLGAPGFALPLIP